MSQRRWVMYGARDQDWRLCRLQQRLDNDHALTIPGGSWTNKICRASQTINIRRILSQPYRYNIIDKKYASLNKPKLLSTTNWSYTNLLDILLVYRFLSICY